MVARLTQNEFIEKAKTVHGEKYGYDSVVYTSAKSKVEIFCKLHGPFLQSPSSHFKGSGCPICGKKKNHTKEDFIEKAKRAHGAKYGYDSVVYNGVHTKVEILCPESNHGLFSQTPLNHAQGHGCPKCSDNHRRSTEEFIAESKAIHGERYVYSFVDFKGILRKVQILCREHAFFAQTPASHLRGQGCPKCAGRHSYTTSEFIEQAKKIHGEKYGYDKVQYVGAHVKTTIFCKNHQADFKQRPCNHLQGSGCPSCAESGYNQNRPGNLYLLQDGPYLKIGITNRDVKDRLYDLNRSRPTPFSIIKTWHFENGEKALNVETMALSLFRLKYKQQAEKWDGFTETFISDDVNHFISTIESIADSLK